MPPDQGTLPTLLLGRIAAFGPQAMLLDMAYSAFLTLRKLWRPAAVLPRPATALAGLHSGHAGEAGAVQIYPDTAPRIETERPTHVQPK